MTETITARDILTDAYMSAGAGVTLTSDGYGNSVLTAGESRIVMGDEYDGAGLWGWTWTTYELTTVDGDPMWEDLTTDAASAVHASAARRAVAHFLAGALSTGYVCKSCGGPAPVGVGYVNNEPGAYAASVAAASCPCGMSVGAR